MSTEIPYVYTDVDYDTITVDDGRLTATDAAAGVSVVVGLLDNPADVVDLVCAILAANGHTGHVLVSRETIDETFAAGRQIGARSMRARSAEAVRALPLLTDSADEVPALAELADRVSAPEGRLSLPGKRGACAIEQCLEEESARSYSQGYEDMREQAMRAASNAPGTPYTPTEAIRNLPFGGDGGTSTVDLGPTHADRPGNLAPCGVSTWDVPASSDLAEVDCVECLRALAQMHGAERPGAGAELPGSDADYDAGFSDGLRMGEARLSAVADSDGEGPETRPGRSRMTEESDG